MKLCRRIIVLAILFRLLLGTGFAQDWTNGIQYGYIWCFCTQQYVTDASLCPTGCVFTIDVINGVTQNVQEVNLAGGTLQLGASMAIDTGTICRVVLAGTNSVYSTITSINGRTDDVVNAQVKAQESNSMTRVLSFLVGATNQTARNVAWTTAMGNQGGGGLVGAIATNYGFASWGPNNGMPISEVFQQYGIGAGTISGVGDPSVEVLGMGETAARAGGFNESLVLPGIEDVVFGADTSFGAVKDYVATDPYGTDSAVGGAAQVCAVFFLWLFNLGMYLVCIKQCVDAWRFMIGPTHNTEAVNEETAGFNLNIVTQKYNVMIWIGSVLAVTSYWMVFSAPFKSFTVGLIATGHAFTSALGTTGSKIAADVVAGLITYCFIDQYVSTALVAVNCIVSTWAIAFSMKMFSSLAKA